MCVFRPGGQCSREKSKTHLILQLCHVEPRHVCLLGTPMSTYCIHVSVFVPCKPLEVKVAQSGPHQSREPAGVGVVLSHPRGTGQEWRTEVHCCPLLAEPQSGSPGEAEPSLLSKRKTCVEIPAGLLPQSPQPSCHHFSLGRQRASTWGKLPNPGHEPPTLGLECRLQGTSRCASSASPLGACLSSGSAHSFVFLKTISNQSHRLFLPLSWNPMVSNPQR